MSFRILEILVNFAFSYIKTEHFLVLNPDLIIDERSIKELLKTAQEDKNCAISAPLILTDRYTSRKMETIIHKIS